MFFKTKIGIAVLILAAFVVGGFAFNAFNVGAFMNGKFFHKGNGDYEGMMGEWKALKGEWKTEMKGFKFGHPFGLFKKFGDEINREVITLDNGIQITITSDNPDVIQMLHDFVEKINNHLEE